MEQKKQSPVLDPQRMQLSEFGRQDWVATVEEHVTVEDVQDPVFWSNTSALMKPYDHIEARCEDGSWIADFVVLGCDRNWARVHLKALYKLTTSDVSLTQSLKYEVRWKGPHRQFCVIRLSDQESIQEKCQTKEAAALWLREYERTTA